MIESDRIGRDFAAQGAGEVDGEIAVPFTASGWRIGSK